MTLTVTAPAPCEGDAQEICVALNTLTPVQAAPSTATDAPDMKPDPVIVSAVPPVSGPPDGETDATLGPLR